jgi:hypothetical protein
VVAVVTALLSMGTSLPASADTLIWARQFGKGTINQATGVAADATGVYVVGTSSSAYPYSDGFLEKFDADGARLFERFRFGKPGREQSVGVAAGVSGVYTITIIDRRKRPPYFSLLSRYDQNGSLAWNVRLVPDLLDMPSIRSAYVNPAAVASDATGVYVAGYVSFQPVGGGYATRAFLAKFDPDGHELWWDRLGKGTSMSGVAVGPSGVAVAGGTDGLRKKVAPGGADALVRLYSNDGQPLWIREFGTADYDYAATVSVDSTGLYIGGVRGDSSTTGFLRKFDFTGETLWHRQLSSPISVRVTSTSPSPLGDGVMVAGWGGDLSGGASDVTVGFVRGYDPDGSVTTTTYINSSSPNSPGQIGETFVNGVATSGDGLFVSGSTAGHFAGQWMHGGLDAFVARVS